MPLNIERTWGEIKEYLISLTDDKLSGRICQYCDKPSVQIPHADGTKVIGCPGCQAWVPQEAPGIAAGLLANKEHRDKKAEVNYYMMKLYLRALEKKQGDEYLAKISLVMWISKQIGTRVEFMRIHKLTLEQLNKIIEVCKPHVKEEYKP